VAGSGEHGNEPSGYIKGGEFLDQMNDYQLLKKDSAPWSWLQIGKSVIKMDVFWDVASCCLVKIDRRFRGCFCHTLCVGPVSVFPGIHLFSLVLFDFSIHSLSFYSIFLILFFPVLIPHTVFIYLNGSISPPPPPRTPLARLRSVASLLLCLS
jgi:hypothetical protein